MEKQHYISSSVLDIREIDTIISCGKKLALSEEARANIARARKYLDEKMQEDHDPIYGINTGFGSLCNVRIPTEQLTRLQENLVMSHACGTGERIGKPIIKLMLLLKIQSLSYGHSGIALETVQRLIDFYNHDLLPVIYSQGSLGASGDLAPLAHLSLPLIGMGELYFEGEIVEAKDVLKKFNWEPIVLQSKEGLALLNGTQFMSAHGMYGLMKSYRLSYWADIIGAISLDAYDCNLSPFDELVQMVRPHRGQILTAQRIRECLNGSEISKGEKTNVQDPYSFRCIPQVHGASKDTLSFVNKCFKTEINSVTDNPNIFVENDRVISGGNFHGQPLALALDYLAIAMAELGSISERRVYQLVSGLRGPVFLVDAPGLNSGFMIPQYTAASIVSQNKQLATPSSIDSIVSSNGQEDHVSMGANAATKLIKVLDNIETVLAIELFNASQALSYRQGLKTSPFLEQLIGHFRQQIPLVKEDVVMAPLIEKSRNFLQSYSIDLEELYKN